MGDQVWRYYDGIAVTPFTNYIFSFYVGNITATNPLVQIAPKINGVLLTPSNVSPVGNGNGSWTKYNYIWNSGFDAVAYPELLNNSTINTAVGSSVNGGDFAIDEISLTKLLSPGGVATGMALWAKTENITGTPANGISTWTNAAGGKSLVQTVQANKPFLSTTASDQINFNPVASFTNAGVDFLTANGGFAGTGIHTSAHVYVVAKSNNTTQTHFFLQENQSTPATNKVEIHLPKSGKVSWAAGNLVTNFVQANFTSSDVNKSLLWSFSKDNAGTASGFKQDIRKNGLVIASNNNTGSFTGANSSLQLGQFDGKVAEAIYYLDANVNAAQQNKIESYLSIKYGLTLGTSAAPQNYTASDGSIFWAANALYHNDVFGIGTDNASGLRQAISNSMNTGSGNGSGQSKKGNLVLKAIAPLADKSFLVIGHTVGTLSEINTDLPATATGAVRLEREWKVNNTGTVGAVDLSFDTVGLTLSGANNLSNFLLLIDEDGDGDFNTGTTTQVNAASMSGKKINFATVTLANNVVFTILTLAPLVTPPVAIATNEAETLAANIDARKRVDVSVKINPNPVRGNSLFLQMSFPETQTAVFSILNANGTKLWQQSKTVNSGVSTLPVQIGNLPDGVYLLRMQVNDKIVTQKFLKAK